MESASHGIDAYQRLVVRPASPGLRTGGSVVSPSERWPSLRVPGHLQAGETDATAACTLDALCVGHGFGGLLAPCRHAGGQLEGAEHPEPPTASRRGLRSTLVRKASQVEPLNR